MTIRETIKTHIHELGITPYELWQLCERYRPKSVSKNQVARYCATVPTSDMTSEKLDVILLVLGLELREPR